MRRCWLSKVVQESQGPRVPRSRGPKVPGSQGPRYLKLTFKHELDSKEGPSCWVCWWCVANFILLLPVLPIVFVCVWSPWAPQVSPCHAPLIPWSRHCYLALGTWIGPQRSLFGTMSLTSCLWLIKLNLSTHDQTPPELGSAGQHGASQIWFFVGNFVSALECVTWCFPADFYVVPKRPWNYHRYGTFPFLDAHFFQFDSKLWHFSHFPTPRPPVQIWVVCGVCQEGSRPPKTPWSFSKSSHEVILYLPLYRLTFVISNVTLSSNLNSVQDSDRQIRILEKWQRLDS